MKKTATLVLLALVTAGPLQAAKSTHKLQTDGIIIFIAKNYESLVAMGQALDAGTFFTDKDLMESLLSCVVEQQTSIKVLKQHELYSDIEVTSKGQSKGCKGTVPNAWIK